MLYQPWRWRQHGYLKGWYPTTTLHGVTTQKTSTWNITAVKASRPTLCLPFIPYFCRPSFAFFVLFIYFLNLSFIYVFIFFFFFFFSASCRRKYCLFRFQWPIFFLDVPILLFLCTLFSNTFNLRSSFSVKDQDSHPHVTRMFVMSVCAYIMRLCACAYVSLHELS
jgi:hypothetical protein